MFTYGQVTVIDDFIDKDYQEKIKIELLGGLDRKKKAIEPYIVCTKYLNQMGIGINAGHDLSLDNIKFFKNNIENLLEVSIGHALISDAIYLGLENTIQMYKDLL